MLLSFNSNIYSCNGTRIVCMYVSVYLPCFFLKAAKLLRTILLDAVAMKWEFP